MYYLYILRNKFGKFYIGQTNNIQRRLQDHGNKNGAKFVKDNGDFELIYFEKFEFRDDAMKREKQIKGWSRAKKEALIQGDKQKLIDLSKNKQS
ncbi:MAG: GIY-YIG nuclease family protein [Candidatus Saccharibacteria bacterium]